MADTRYDITVFGATGLTGSHIVEHVFELSVSQPEMYAQGFRWAIAGRNQERMKELVQEYMSKYPGATIPEPDILIANVVRRDTTDAMAKQSKVIINAVGPFRFAGEYVVRSCVENKCDYVDVTGEPEFVERMQRTYHDQARKNGTTIVHCCGFDSIPADMGSLFVKELYEAKGWSPVHIEMFLRMYSGETGLHGGFGTYESAVHGVGSAEVLREMRKVSGLAKLPRPGPPLKLKNGVHFNRDMQMYTIPFPGSDSSVVRLSQQLLLSGYGQPPKPVTNKTMPPTIQFTAYILLPSFWIMVLMVVYGTIFSFLAATPWGRNLLLNHPERFSHGVFSKKNPTDEQLKDSSFEMTLLAKGYTSRTVPNGNVDPDCNAKIVVRGPEPGYIATPRIVLQSALALLQGKANGQVPFGVLTPSAAFWNTDLLKRLPSVGISLEEVVWKEKITK
ncbi:Saccharopine dehydrogenase-domain-containing protein [Zychaea mexicana]|uniref:Saccharopine dehydrogenase-domain-containing protein n=1 Tax=Zychaea mexicana TaxID=64656 RepID=UPI0022FEFEB3|nr:Saccharopine dehydrogenase-domain-containing protein [Zychaea mexicana]KAI9495351.1 Saccharopine dehydrogenase-domain-containing protein [Zychaea mexicana]